MQFLKQYVLEVIIGQGDFDAALTFDACSVSLRQLNFVSVVELTFAAILEV
jgi:hypothetical protein